MAHMGMEGIRVLDLETVKHAQAKEILTLNARIKKLEKRCKLSISHHKAWLRSVSLLSKKKKLSERESVSKQGRKNAKSRPTKDESAKLDVELDEDLEYMDTEETMNEGRQSKVDTARPDDDTARPDVSIARQKLSTAGLTTTPTTTTIFNDEEMTLADTLIKLKDDKDKGVTFKDSENTDRPARSILTLKPLPTIDPKDKGKGVLEEPESAKKMTKSDFDDAQIVRDEDIARQLEVKLQADEKREREREEQASMNYIANLYDEVQARIDADHELAELIADFVPIGSEEDERRIRDMNKKAKEESTNKDGTEIHMLAERRLMNLEGMIDERRIFKCWFYHHTTNGHQFTMSNRHQELASPEVNGFCKELASPKQTALALAIPEQTATGKETSNPFMADKDWKLKIIKGGTSNGFTGSKAKDDDLTR
uniref:Uncharacterized protein n=1 Tax=Tanacetum cinerariifolium TaxID=118510 RepID=A0A699H2I3_TANCI|nr:hypothetical protein [Tanacetum cinerariifolium]